MLFIGIDLSDKTFDYCISNSNGDVLTINKFDFDDDGFSDFVHKINEHESENQNCIIGIENPRSRLVDFLIQRGFNVIPTHPLSISKYRESRIPSKAKSDPMDARLIADYIREHHKSLRTISMPDDTIRELSILLEDREKLVEQKVKFSNQLTSTLKAYFPQALEAFGSITNKSALEFLSKFDTHQEVRALLAKSSQELDDVLADCGFFRTDSRERFHSAMSKRPSSISPAVIKAKIRLKNVLVGHLLLLTQQIEDYEKQIQKLMDDTPDSGIFRSLPGADYILGARWEQDFLFFTAVENLLLPMKHKPSGEHAHTQAVQVLRQALVSERAVITLAETLFISLHSVHLKVVNGQRSNMPRSVRKVKGVIMPYAV